jgi:two-component system, OmpR family, response regulator
MDFIDPSISEHKPLSAKDPDQTESFRNGAIENRFAEATVGPTRVERADSRTEQAETRTDEANKRTEQAEVRTEQANLRTEQAEARTEQAELRTQQAEARNAGTVATTPTRTGKKRILAVDDQASNTRLVKLYLERTNHYVVREENDPRAALSTAEEFKPDLILLDVMMPGMDGGDLAACFQASPKLKSVPIVFLTAVVTKGEVEAGRGRVGGYTFLAKPVVLTEVLACLQHHLGE